MNVYLATAWGNEDDGPDGPDTNLLISASDLHTCICIAEQTLSSTSQLPDVINLLGTNSDQDEEYVMLGPWRAPLLLRSTLNAMYREYDWGVFPDNSDQDVGCNGR